MKRSIATATALASLLAFGSAQQFYRRGVTPLDAISLTPAQRQAIDRASARFAPRLKALQASEHKGKNVSEARDALNRDYSKALLGAITPPQRTKYLEAVYRQVQDFLATHPKVAFEDVFVWGGAYAKRPASRT